MCALPFTQKQITTPGQKRIIFRPLTSGCSLIRKQDRPWNPDGWNGDGRFKPLRKMGWLTAPMFLTSSASRLYVKLQQIFYPPTPGSAKKDFMNYSGTKQATLPRKLM